MEDQTATAGENLCNQYLNLTDSQMARDHQWEAIADAPCSDTRYGPQAVEAYLSSVGRAKGHVVKRTPETKEKFR